MSMITKKDLEARFGITDNTVYKTIAASGLDTGKEEYTEEEIEAYFVPARALLGAGKKYKEVETWAKGKREGSGNVSPSTVSSGSPLFGDEFERAAEKQVLELAEGALERAALRAAPQMGRMLLKVLQTERVKRAFIDGMVDTQAFRKEVLEGFGDYYERYQAGTLLEGSDDSEGETIDVTPQGEESSDD